MLLSMIKGNSIPETATQAVGTTEADMQVLRSLSSEQLVEIVLQQQQTINRMTEAASPVPGRPSPSHYQPTSSKSSVVTSAPVTSVKTFPFWSLVLVSLGLHGLLLATPLPEQATEQAQEQEELLTVTELPPVMGEPPVTSESPVTPEPPVTSEPLNQPQPTPPQPIAPAPQLPVPQPAQRSQPPISRPRPVEAPRPVTPAEPLEPTPIVSPPPNQEVNPTAAPTATPTVEATTAPADDPAPTQPPEEPAFTAIAGVPISSGGQFLEDPRERLVSDRSSLYLGLNQERHPDVLGQFVAPNQAPSEFFAGYRPTLEAANFRIRPEGAYEGAPSYRLTPASSGEALFLTMEPTGDGTGTVITVWKRYPWQVNRAG